MSDLIARIIELRDVAPTKGEWHELNDIVKEVEEQQARIAKLEDALTVCNQFMLEVSHAMQSGPSWYTKGTHGLRQQIYMWIERTRKALAALDKD